jgi:GNAT superfamily N-acetyltransferase
MSDAVSVRPIDFDVDAADFVSLLDHYAQDPMGGGTGLGESVKGQIVDRLREIPHYYGAIALVGARAVGLINCFFGFSTFAAEPLLNIHDVVVADNFRGVGVGQALLAHVEAIAVETGCCKLTLEVLSNNHAALRAYERAGFKPYVLDPSAGQAMFLQKRL